VGWFYAKFCITKFPRYAKSGCESHAVASVGNFIRRLLKQSIDLSDRPNSVFVHTLDVKLLCGLNIRVPQK
jgi:hypothetical protein